MTWLAINTTHTPGNSFDCAGAGCPGSTSPPAWVTGTNGWAETYSCTVATVAQTCIHEEIDTGALANNTPTTVTLPLAIPTAIFGDPTCSDNGGRVQSGNDQAVGANHVGLSAPFTSIFVNTPSTGMTAHCKLDGY
jgi:hypothetical protein